MDIHTVSRRAFAAGLGASGIALAARSGRAAQDAGASTMTLATGFVPADLDPHSAYYSGSGVPLQGPFEGLIRLQPGAFDAYEPVLAESWSSNDDHSVWTFTLRDGIHFQDGAPCDAEAVLQSFLRLFTLKLAPSNVLGRFIADPSQISAPDTRTVVFNLGRPQPRFEAAISSPMGTAIVDAALLKTHEVDGDWGHGWAQTASDGVGTGPYQITSYDLQEGVRLSRYDDYWRGWGGNHFDEIIIRIVLDQDTRRALIETGEADIAEALSILALDALASNPDVVLVNQYTLDTVYFALAPRGVLATPEARQALCWAFPYDDVIKGVYEGRAKQAIGPIAENCRGFDPDTFTYHTDLDQARALLAQAGVPKNTTLHMILPNTNSIYQQMGELFQANLQKIDIKLDIQIVDPSGYAAIALSDMPEEERPEIIPLIWSPDYDDGWSHIWTQLSCNAWYQGNAGHYCNNEVEPLLDQARDAEDDATYTHALSQIQQIVTKDDPASIYIAQPEWTTVHRHDLAGYVPHAIIGELFDFYSLSRTN